MTQALDWLERLIGFVAAMLVLAFTVIILVDVVCRYWLLYSLSWPAELTILLFQWTCFLGAALALRRGAHFGLDILVSMLSPRQRTAGALLSLLLVGAANVVIIVACVPMIRKAQYSIYPTLPLSHAIVYYGVLASAVLMLVFTVEQGVLRLRGETPRHEPAAEGV
jgi:TRAP-type C4-dicarboxylate transport system permease small subunit